MLKELPVWASREVVIETLPVFFKAHSPDILSLVIVRAVYKMPHSLNEQSQTYSAYKIHNTAIVVWLV